MSKQLINVPTTNRGRMVRKMLLENGGRMCSVTFVKKDGSVRTLVGNFGHVADQSGHNNASHYEKYVCMILPEKDPKTGKQQRRNIDCEKVLSIKTNGAVVNFQ